MSSSLGVGMHPWGKWGRNFVEYGVVAARAALADAGRRLARRAARRRRRHRPQRLPRLRRRRDVRAGARLDRRAGRVVVRRLRLGRTGARGRARRRSSPGCATSHSSSARTRRRRASSRPTPASGRTTPTGCASGCSARPTRPTSRSTRAAGWTLYGATERDFAEVKVEERAARLEQPQRALPQGRLGRGRPGVADGRRSVATCSRSARRPTAAPRSC